MASTWSAIEMQIPIATICFPTLRKLYSHIFHRQNKSTSSSSPSSNNENGLTPEKSSQRYWYSENTADVTNTAGSVSGANGDRVVGTEELMLNDVGGILGSADEGRGGAEGKRLEGVDVEEASGAVVGLESALQEQEGKVRKERPA